MYKYLIILKTKSNAMYRVQLTRNEDSIPKVHNLIEKCIAERDFLWTAEEYMVRTSEIEAFKVYNETQEEKQND